MLCQSPNASDVSQRPANQGPPQTIDHRIQTGENMESDYAIYGFGQTKISFAGVQFPGDLRDCARCHTGTTYTLPLPAGLI